jgi:chromosomal replication initiation ATPase DnaA
MSEKLPPMRPLDGETFHNTRPNRNNNNIELGERIGHRVAEIYGTTFDDLKSIKRTELLSWQRAVAMDICQIAGLTQETTGKVFNRKHSTVSYARRRVNTFCNAYKDLAEDRAKVIAEFVDLT